MARGKKAAAANVASTEAKYTSTNSPASQAGLFPGEERHAAVVLTKIPLDLIVENDNNPNVQSREQLDRLKADMREDGFDEAPQVVPMWGDPTKRETWSMSCPPDPTGENPNKAGPSFYRLMGGQWRRRALLELGFTHVDCVVKTGWDELKLQIKTTARNINRGSLDDSLFTKQVNDIVTSYGVQIGELPELMGFQDDAAFMAHYQREEENRERTTRTKIENDAADAERELANIDNLQLILNELLKRYGDTLPNDFMHFFYLRKMHLMVRLNSDARKAIDKMVKALRAEKADLAELEAKGLPVTDAVSINEFLIAAIDAELDKRAKKKERVAEALATPDTAKV